MSFLYLAVAIQHHKVVDFQYLWDSRIVRDRNFLCCLLLLGYYLDLVLLLLVSNSNQHHNLYISLIHNIILVGFAGIKPVVYLHYSCHLDKVYLIVHLKGKYSLLDKCLLMKLC